MPEESASPDNQAVAFALFVRDLRRSLLICVRDPRLPLTFIALGMLENGPGQIVFTTGGYAIASIVGVAATLYFAGFVGAVRHWFVRVDQDVPFAWSEVRKLTGDLRWRFIRVGLLYACIVIVPLVVLGPPTKGGSLLHGFLWLAVYSAFNVAFSFAWTVLAFNDGTARGALGQSLGVLRAQWPKCAWYVLVGALLGGLSQILRTFGLGVPTLLALDVALGGLSLLCGGATVLFYADRYATLRA